MAKSPRPDDEDRIADASSLFGDDPPRPSSTPRPPASRAIPIGEGYEVEGFEPDEPPPPAPRAQVAPSRPKKKKPSEAEERRPARPDRDEPRVLEVWTRWGEWGPAVLRLGIVGAVVMVLVYMVGSASGLGPAFLVLVMGGAVWIALTYPIAVTLERPIRMTPEQAVKDYYAALSHHFPQYRRMWLLLSEEGRHSPEFDSFGDFQATWKKRLAELRGGRVKSSVPLNFEVADFRADKSAGLTTIDASYTLNIRARGGPDEPLASVPIEASLAKGPDSMWYLDSGMVPKPR